MEYEIINVFNDNITEYEIKNIINEKLSVIAYIIEFS